MKKHVYFIIHTVEKVNWGKTTEVIAAYAQWDLAFEHLCRIEENLKRAHTWNQDIFVTGTHNEEMVVKHENDTTETWHMESLPLHHSFVTEQLKEP